MVETLVARKSGPLSGTVTVPGDKSISHRALILGALSTGVTHITGLLEAEDVMATARALEALGVPMEKREAAWEVRGRGVAGLMQPDGPLDFGNSGTGCRLMMGVIAGHPMKVAFTGDASLCSRPMGRVLTPLRQMGLGVGGEEDRLPLTLEGSADLVPIEYELPVPSAQIKSAVLLAGLHAPGGTTIIEPEATRDHTERMLRHFGARICVKEEKGVRRITVTGDAELEGRAVIVPADPSSASFPVAAAAVLPGSQVTVTGVLINPTRTGFFTTLKEMGADLRYENEREEGGESVADISITASALRGVTVPPGRAPSMIDEYPVLAVVAAFAKGETRMEGLGELRVKESDRLASTLAGLRACGVEAEIQGDALIVRGGETVKGGGLITTHMDHRIAMAFLVLGLAAQNLVTIDDASVIATSFTGFTSLMSGLGAQFSSSAVT